MTPPETAAELDHAEAPSPRGEAIRARVVAAALAEFSEHGWGGARVDRIARRSGVNKRLVYLHAGNKEALWIAALERVYADIRSGEARLKIGQLEPLNGLETLIRFNFRFHAEHPEFLSLLNEENRQQAAHLRKSRRIAGMHSPLVAMLQDVLDRGAAAGMMRRGLDAVQLYISIAALSYFYCSNRHTLSTIFERDLSAPHEMLDRERHVVEFVLNAVRLPAP